LRAKREHGSREPKLPPQNAVAARV
jgi:hypothetical protein